MKVTTIGRCGAYPTEGQATAGYLIETQHGTLLVDCGSGVVDKVQRFIEVQDLTAVIISHYHHDHVADLGVLQYSALITTQTKQRTRPLQVYLPNHVGANPQDWEFSPWTESIIYNADQNLNIIGLDIRFLPTRHAVPCFAMRFEEGDGSFCYSADTSYLPDLIPFAKDADLFVCETSLYEGQDGSVAGHLTGVEVGEIAQAAQVKRLVMTHLPPYGNHQDLVNQGARSYDGPIDLCRLGEVYEV